MSNAIQSLKQASPQQRGDTNSNANGICTVAEMTTESEMDLQHPPNYQNMA